MAETATAPDPHNVQTTANHLLIRGVPHLTDEGLAGMLADTATSADATLSAFAKKTEELKDDPTLSDEGRAQERAELGRLHAETLHARKTEALERLERAIDRNEGKLFAKRGFGIPDTADPEEYRAQEREARALFREMLDAGDEIKVKAKLMEAARAGDLQTMRVFIAAPSAFPLVPENTLEEAIRAYAEATQPETFREWEQQNTARTMIEDNYRRAWKNLERMAGTRYTISDQ